MAIESCSNFPSATLYNPHSNFIDRCELFKPLNTCSKVQNYSPAYLIDDLEEMFKKNGLQPHQIKTVMYCNGPGFFSKLRTGNIFVRSFKLLNPLIPVYKFNLLFLLFFKLKKLNLWKENYLILPAGKSGFYKESYKNNFFEVLDKAQFMSHINSGEKVFDYQLLDGDLCLSDVMVDIYNFVSASLIEAFLDEDLQPLYLRQASVTTKKQVVF